MKWNVFFLENEKPISAHFQPSEVRIFDMRNIWIKYQAIMIVQNVLKKLSPKSVIRGRFNSNKEMRVAIIGNPISTARVFDKGIALGISVFCIILKCLVI